METNLSPENYNCYKELLVWVKDEANFKGRIDCDFLLSFLRSCDFDLKLTKKTMYLYYESRVKFPEWWTNRDIQSVDFQKFLQSNIVTIVYNKDDRYPGIAIGKLSNVGDDSSVLNSFIKSATIFGDVGARHLNCQLNGAILIVDFQNCPTWLIMQSMWPSFIRKMTQAFLYAVPLKIKALVVINCPSIGVAICRVARPIIPIDMRQKFYCFGSDWRNLKELIPLHLLPNEYGGSSGPMKFHRDAFIDELMTFKEYFMEEMKYGFT